jgi:hypothetical protein
VPWAGIINRAFTAENVGAYLRTLPRPTFVRFVVVHNTGAPSLATYRGYAARKTPISDSQWLRNLEGYYRDKQKWKAGPHWFVTPNKAGLLAFTPSTVPGTHSPSWNSQSLGVEMVGDYQVEPFDAGVQRNVIALLAELHIWLRLDPNTIRFHREDVKTTHKDCPGKNVDKAKLIAAVRAKMDELQSVKPAMALDVPNDTDVEPATVVVPVDASPAEPVAVQASAEADNETRTGWLRRKWKSVTGWFSGVGGVGVLGYLTDWRVVAVLFGGIVAVAILFILFMGPGDVRAWIRKQVS